ncbi:uncharacterized protein AMSG_00366 [Thecamonas trahens ATCC 50062]|uniref:Uncharacterized protein n=1 Tax=Thecamonas trahens ATCC 50062 TaxID=461836 RepID=A0A0L0D8D6_THETB|nr:hypothetical protein AMSG_00366 [Thecamonas trahens ATCC 50062]KNC48589.1 hypothetical protein AMSG_00366 [Thecamonas trahens ATCC 50062]|eukprot:XP_013762645.1 hypothetical protein AMSG_00366 [Thecamonas trahens ATCC 50062]
MTNSLFRLVLVAVLVACAVTARGARGAQPHRFPGIMLCGPRVDAKTATMTFRASRTGAFVEMAADGLTVVQVGDAGQPHAASSIPCLVFNGNGGKSSMIGMPGESVGVVNASSIAIEYISLFDPLLPVPTFLDEYTDLIWAYYDHALVNVFGRVGSQFSAILHTHPYPDPPQIIWIELDALYTYNVHDVE